MATDTTLAAQIVEALFKNCIGETAHRIVMMEKTDDGERDIGGLCRSAAIERIADILKENTNAD